MNEEQDMELAGQEYQTLQTAIAALQATAGLKTVKVDVRPLAIDHPNCGWLRKRPRYQLHFTPTHASWLNQVERWFALLSERQIKRGSHRSVQQLEHAIREFIKVHNQQPKPFSKG